MSMPDTVRVVITVSFPDQRDASRAYQAIEKLLHDLGEIGTLSMTRDRDSGATAMTLDDDDLDSSVFRNEPGRHTTRLWRGPPTGPMTDRAHTPDSGDVDYEALASQVIDFVADELDLEPGRAAAVLAVALGAAMAQGEAEGAGSERITEGFKKVIGCVKDAYIAEAFRIATATAADNPGDQP